MDVAIVGDIHTNSTVGLCPPYVELDDGGSYKASKLQLALWKAWQDFCDFVKARKQERNTPLCVVLNGDIVDGDHHNTYQIISRNPATMLKLAYNTLSPLIELADRLYVVRGTRAHSGGSGSMEETLAEDLGAVENPETGAFSWWHLCIDTGGVTFDIAHHATMGRLPWTAPNAANKLVSIVQNEYINSGRWPPKLVFRSHNHRFADSNKHYKLTRAIYLPCWTGKTEYIYRLDPLRQADIGGVYVDCQKEPELHIRLYEPKLERPQKF